MPVRRILITECYFKKQRKFIQKKKSHIAKSQIAKSQIAIRITKSRGSCTSCMGERTNDYSDDMNNGLSCIKAIVEIKLLMLIRLQN